MSTPSAEACAPEPMPEQIGSYRIARELGSGGMGTVYLGVHDETGVEAAVKVLPASMARESGFIARFDREVAAMRKLKSPHIVSLLESGEQNGTFYYAMEFVPGETLADRLAREKRLSWREAIEIGVQICRALKAAHNCGVIHRDLKPSNLLLHEDGTVKLSDFGIAQIFATSKLTVTGGILGTAEYMSPEQAQGKRASKQSDLYSLGAVLYVMLTGRPPFTGKTTLEVAQKHKFAQFDSPKRIVMEIPMWLDEIVCKCLAKKTEDRYPDAYVLSLRLQEVPKKVELREGGSAPLPEIGPNDETLIESSRSGRREGEVGGTLARDLFQAQIEAEQAPSQLGRVFDNTWFLIALLVAVIAAGVGLARWNRPTPDALFERGRELMSRREGPAWELARRDSFEPLLDMDEQTWRPRIEPFLHQIQLYELKKELLGRDSADNAYPQSEPEAILRQAIELRNLGRIPLAREKLSALAALLSGDQERAPLRDLVLKLLDELPSEGTHERLDYVRQALQRADEFQQAGNTAEARSIWRSVQALYHADPDARELVRAAREKLQQAE